MKATGIVRRIDDLGRVVIPKEIRRTMRIREGDPLEIYTDREGEVIFKKYSPIGELAVFAGEYAETLHKTCALSVVICDRDSIIACAGLSKKENVDRKISRELDAAIEARSLYSAKDGETMPVCADNAAFYVRCMMPIFVEGDVIGCVAAVAPTDADAASKKGAELSADAQIKLIQTAASFLGKQLEA